MLPKDEMELNKKAWPIKNGGTGATTAEDALKALGVYDKFLALTGGVMRDQIIMINNVVISFIDEGADWNADRWFAISKDGDGLRISVRNAGKDRIFYFNCNEKDLNDALSLWYYDDGSEHFSRFFGEHNTELLAPVIQNLLKGGSVSMVKSVQRGIIWIGSDSTEATATITAVNTSKAVVLFGGSSTSASSSNSAYLKYSFVNLALTNSTTVTASRADSGHANLNVPYQVVEYY